MLRTFVCNAKIGAYSFNLINSKALHSFSLWFHSFSMDCNTTNNDAPVVEDIKPTFTISEGKVTISSSSNVFYNPVQEFNRDLSIAVLTLFASDSIQFKEKQNIETESKISDFEELVAGKRYENGIRVLEALSATGLRSIRYAKEVPGIKEIIANDISEQAIANVKQNIIDNKMDHLVSFSHDDASMVMYRNRSPEKRFDALDLDPFGCPSIFLDGAVQSVNNGGLLLVTCTDMAVLAGNTPETCYVKYGAISLKMKSCHEMALRIVLQCIESHANRYGRYIVPLLSISADFYVRVFVKVFISPVKCKKTTSLLSHVYQCVGCESFTLQPLGIIDKNPQKPNLLKYSLPHGPPIGLHCEHCGSEHKMGGPIWNGPLYDSQFVERLQDLVSKSTFGTSRRLQGVLAVIQEELPNVPLYYSVDKLCSVVHCTSISMLQFRSALLNAGYRVSFSHANKTSIKTDAPTSVIWDIIRCWVKTHPVQEKRLVGVSASILAKAPSIEADFTIRKDSNPQSRAQKLVRYQENPLPYWGPGTRGTCISAENVQRDKCLKLQGKSKRKRESNSPDSDAKKCNALEESIEN